MNVPQVGGKPKLSWSSIDALLRCHLRFTLHYVDKERPADDARRFVEGRALHNGLARWWRLPLQSKRPLTQETCMVKGFAEEAAKAKIQWQGEKDRSRARERVLKAGRNAQAVMLRERIFGPEPYVEEEFATDFEGFHLVGRYDLFLETLDGDLVLVDYKYSENERYGHRLQLVTQAIGVRALHGELPTVAGFLLCKGSTQRFRIIRFRDGEAEVEQFAERLCQAWADYQHTPREPRFDVWKCDWCSVRAFCQVFQDTHPSGGRGDIVHGNRIRIKL